MCVIINHFYFLPFSYVLGTAANCWLTLMGRLLTPEVSVSQKDSIKIKMLELVDIYYLALDAPKTGNEVIFSPGLVLSISHFFLLMLEIGLWLTILKGETLCRHF